MVIFVIKREYRILVKGLPLTLDSLVLNASPVITTCVTLSKMPHFSEAQILHLKWNRIDERIKWVHALCTALGTFYSLKDVNFFFFFCLLLGILWMLSLCLVPLVLGRHNNNVNAEITESSVYEQVGCNMHCTNFFK